MITTSSCAPKRPSLGDRKSLWKCCARSVEKPLLSHVGLRLSSTFTHLRMPTGGNRGTRHEILPAVVLASMLSLPSGRQHLGFIWTTTISTVSTCTRPHNPSGLGTASGIALSHCQANALPRSTIPTFVVTQCCTCLGYSSCHQSETATNHPKRPVLDAN